MKTKPMLEELWQIKDHLAREAGYDTRHFLENLRKWAAEHPHPGRVAHDAGELRRLADAQERQRDESESGAMTLNDQPPPN